MVGLIVGGIMLAIGIFLLGRPMLMPQRAVTGSRWLELAFAAFFLLRGGMNVHAALRSRGAPEERR